MRIGMLIALALMLGPATVHSQEKQKSKMIRPQLKAKGKVGASGMKAVDGREGKLESTLKKGITADEEKEAKAAKAKGKKGKAKKGKGSERFEEAKARAAERKEKRDERRKEAREQLRERVKAALKGRSMDPALREELERHARRSARLNRVEELAARAEDEDALARVEKLLAKEKQRHDAWMSKFDGAGAEAGENK